MGLIFPGTQTGISPASRPWLLRGYREKGGGVMESLYEIFIFFFFWFSRMLGNGRGGGENRQGIKKFGKSGKDASVLHGSNLKIS